MNILYVEDNAINRLIATKSLSKEYYIDAVETVEEAFELVEKKEYQIFLIDLNLNNPDIDGFGVLSHLKQQPNIENAVFIAHTNYTGDDWKEKCLSAGFDFFMPKPLDASVLSSFLNEQHE